MTEVRAEVFFSPFEMRGETTDEEGDGANTRKPPARKKTIYLLQSGLSELVIVVEPSATNICSGVPFFHKSKVATLNLTSISFFSCSGSQSIWANLIYNISNFLPGCFCIISRGGLFALPYILVPRAWTSRTSTSTLGRSLAAWSCCCCSLPPSWLLGEIGPPPQRI